MIKRVDIILSGFAVELFFTAEELYRLLSDHDSGISEVQSYQVGEYPGDPSPRTLTVRPSYIDGIIHDGPLDIIPIPLPVDSSEANPTDMNGQRPRQEARVGTEWMELVGR